jgi:hypothetical protein
MKRTFLCKRVETRTFVAIKAAMSFVRAVPSLIPTLTRVRINVRREPDQLPVTLSPPQKTEEKGSKVGTILKVL